MCDLALFIVISAIGSAPTGDPLPPGAVLRLGEARFRASGEIRHLRFSPDGTILLGWTKGPDAALHPVAWMTSTGIPIPPSGIHFPPDVPERTTPAARLSGDRLVTAGPGCCGRVWDAGTSRQLASLSGHSAAVTAVAVSRDGKQIATGSADGLVKLWDADTFRPITTLGGHTSAVKTIRVSANGTRAATVGEDRTVRVWDLEKGKELRGFLTTGTIDLTADGTAVVMAAGEGALVRDVLTGLEVVPDSQPSRPCPTFSELLGTLGFAVAFSPDGRVVAVGHADGTIGLYEGMTAQCRRLLSGHQSRIRALAFTPDGSRLLTTAADHTVLVWAVRLQDLPLIDAIQHERRAGRLWSLLATGSAEAAYQAMARFAAEPPAAVKMARLRLRPAESLESEAEEQLANKRGVELLESLGTTAAREFLEELARGEPTACLTVDARLALARMKGK